ncbi:bifunctional DNA primase/polymerase [Shimia aestuarii]|uniref:Bifunctional DNA primase/polymerase, N-terminal n=1 Tax=Shimia aestuarii TaxID=254406 RepID=A0A1I4IT11_9RHOB|nr:bifunctional DNA primase/polymerase [Shimia aestuarii]SFL57445.1 Bifunctional DNA primase/polymerase, N-terminal [Shimia aestuarii]
MTEAAAQKTADTQAPEKKAKPKPPLPFDPLPVKGIWGVPSKRNPYHTKRGRDAYADARQRPYGRYWNQAAATLFDAGLRRDYDDPSHAGSALHNTYTLAAAMHYGDCGLHAIDCHGLYNTGYPTLTSGKGIKHPRGAGWQNESSTSHDKLGARWTGDGKYPADKEGDIHDYAAVDKPRNVGLTFPPGCGMFVLDEDGETGMQSVLDLEAKHGKLPETWTSVSGSGGQHRIFKADVQIHNSSNEVGPKIDIRGKNGCIVAAPSVHPSLGYYQWKEGCAPGEIECAEAPEWLVTAALEASKQTQTKAGHGRRLRPEGQAPSKVYEPKEPSGDSRGFEAHLSNIGDHAGGKGFNAPIYSAACSWFSAHGADADTAELLTQLQDAIAVAERKGGRGKSTKYDTESHLLEEIENARRYIRSKEAEAAAFEAAGGGEFDAESQEHSGKSPSGDGIKLETRADVSEAVKNLGDTPEQEALDSFIDQIEAPLTAVIAEELAKRLKTVSGLPIAEVRKMLKHLKGAVHDSDFPLVSVSESFREACAETYAIMTDQGNEPELFHSTERLVDIREDENGNINIRAIGKDRYKALMEDRIDFESKGEVGEAPQGVVNNVYQKPLTGYPALHRVISSPVYDVDKNLITEPGYHAASGLYYKPKEGVIIPPVSAVPTEDEVRETVSKLVDVFADFPLDALSREQMTGCEIERDEDQRITKETYIGGGIVDGLESPSFCHLLSVGMTSICRDFILGATPGHLGRKDQPRSGATLALSNIGYMATLQNPAPQSLPNKADEVSKTVMASVDSGRPQIFFDNMPDDGKVDFGELAAAMTAYPLYSGRRLGVTEMIDAAVRAVFMFTGNRTHLSKELADRMILIDIDPEMENPGDRPTTSFKYNLAEHVPAYAGEYLHCLLTLVQNWIAKGCPEWSGQALGGFESHAKVIGGILEAAGIKGFLGNRDKMKTTVKAVSPEAELLDAMIDLQLKVPTLFRVGEAHAAPKEVGKVGERKPFEYADHRVISIMKDVLNVEGIAMKNWGYLTDESGNVFYPDKARNTIAGFIGNMSPVREWRDEQTEEVQHHGRYVLKKAHKDKHGTLYRFEKLDLI